MKTPREYRLKKITPKNEYLMKKCFADLYASGIIPSELFIKSQKTDYIKRGK